MVYGRQYDDQLLNFEASGGLKQASLIMRDRETDSWWSIMTSTAIGGELDGTALKELPIGEKTSWGEWKARHPKTKILSVDGQEHSETNPYDNYFSSDGTFRDIKVEDDRLAPKESIFAFTRGGKAYAVQHTTAVGGRLFELEDGSLVLFERQEGESLFRSTRAYLVTGDSASSPKKSATQLLAEHSEDLVPLAGFDTFWYSWVLIQSESEVLR